MKRLPTFLLFTFILSSIGTKVLGQEVYETIDIDGIVYRITNYDESYYDEDRFDGEVEVYYCYYKDNYPRPANIILPKSVPYNGGNYIVTSIGDQVFERYYDLESINLPENLVNIGSSAFEGCSNLSSLELPSSVMSIGENAFKDCSGLSTIFIPEQVTYIGEKAFEYCHISSITVEVRNPIDISENVFEDIWSATLYVPYVSLEKYEAAEYWNCFSKILPINDFIDFEDSNVKALCLENWDTNGDGNFSVDEAAAVTDLGKVFKDNNNITTFDELRFFKGLTNLNLESFNNCYNLTSIIMPSSLSSIRNLYQTHPTHLKTIKVDPNNTVYDSRDNCNAIIETQTNKLIFGCSQTSIPNTVKAISNYAFSQMYDLTTIFIPDGVTSIGASAFEGTGLTEVNLPNSVAHIDWNAFRYTPWEESQPDDLIYIGKVAYLYKGTMPANTSIIIKDGTIGIAGGAFDGSFTGSQNLTTVVIPNTVTTIGRYAFDSTKLNSIDFPESVYQMGPGVFGNTPWLKSQSDGLIYMGKVAYGYKGEIKDSHISLKDGTRCIAGDAFCYHDDLYSVSIPSSVEFIGELAFSGCSSLTSVIVNNPVPIDITIETFSNRKNATLYVPFGCRVAYEAADYWKEFKEIVEMEPVYPAIEDFAVILDGEKQTLHGRMVAQDGEEYIITDSGIYRVTGRRERLAGDVNGDGKITIADVTELVNVILGHTSAESATIYNAERVEGVTGLTGDCNFIGWGGIDEDGSLDPDVKKQRQ